MQWNPCENHLLKDKKKGVQYKKYYFLYYFFKIMNSLILY